MSPLEVILLAVAWLWLCAVVYTLYRLYRVFRP
jgi:hypothetical protein